MPGAICVNCESAVAPWGLRLRGERADADQAGKRRQSNAIHGAQYALNQVWLKPDTTYGLRRARIGRLGARRLPWS